MNEVDRYFSNTLISLLVDTGSVWLDRSHFWRAGICVAWNHPT
jgi:hypothetical protein